MEKIETYDDLSVLINKHFKIGVVTNCYFSKDTLEREISENNLYAEDGESALFILRKRKDFNILNFYFNSDSIDLSIIPPNTVCEIPYRDRDIPLISICSYFKNNGFYEMFSRIRMTNDRKCEYEKSDSVVFADSDDMDSIINMYSDLFNKITGCIPSNSEIFADICNKNYYVYRKDNEIAGFLHSVKNKNIYEIRHLAVKEQYRGQHFASELVSSFLSANKSKSRVWVREDYIPALTVYKKFSFIPDSFKSKLFYKN